MQVQKSEFIFGSDKPSFFLVTHLTLRRSGSLLSGSAGCLQSKSIDLESYNFMTNDMESEGSTSDHNPPEPRQGWLRIGLVAAASAVAGGMAAAWWYRKTLNKLHESGENGENPQFGISAGDPSEDSFEDV
jgi:hypothetical protein